MDLPVATKKETVQNVAVLTASLVLLGAASLAFERALRFGSLYAAAGFIGLTKKTHYSNLFKK